MNAEDLRSHYRLRRLPREGGWFVERHASATSSSIWYLLDRREPINYLHRLTVEDTHAWLSGGPADYYLFGPEGQVLHHRLWAPGIAGTVAAVTAPAGWAKAIVLPPDVSHLLVLNVLAPPWSPEAVTYGLPPDQLQRYLGAARWATAAFLASLQPPPA